METETEIEYRLKKAESGEIFGPLSEEKLKELAHTALIAPDDKVDVGDEQWMPASEVRFLEMDWVVETDAGQSYGPTSLGTIREFYGQGEIKLTDKLTNIKTKEIKTVGTLLNIDLGRAEILGSTEDKGGKDSLTETGRMRVHNFDADALKNLERAKDLRIRQLESDLEKAREEHEQLLQKFRKLTEDYIQIKKAVIT